MMRVGSNSSSCLMKSSRVSTFRAMKESPPCRNSRSRSSASLTESSSIRIRSSDFMWYGNPISWRRGLVQKQPVQAKLLYGGGELIELHRLAHEAVGACFVTSE